MGYINLSTDEIISDEDAFLYALEKVETDPDDKENFHENFTEDEIQRLNSNEALQKEFIEWFYSGNYCRKEIEG